MVERTVIKLESSEFVAALSELKLYFEVTEALLHVPKSLLRRCLRLFNTPSELCRIEARSTKRATTTIRLKPSDSFLDFLSALRASNLQRLAIK